MFKELGTAKILMIKKLDSAFRRKMNKSVSVHLRVQAIEMLLV